MPARNLSASSLGSARADDASNAGYAALEPDDATVWVLEDSRHAEPCLAIAERLGMEFRRVPLRWQSRLSASLWRHGWLANLRRQGSTAGPDRQGSHARPHRQGSIAGLASPLPLMLGPPALTLSSGRRAAAVAAWLKQACGSRMVHYGPAGLHGASADLRVLDMPPERVPRPGVLPVLGAPHRANPLSFRAARATWLERLQHLPRPRLALLVGTGPFGAELQPCEAFRLGAGLADAMHGAQGAILAVADRRCGREATDALASGLSRCLHILYREGEPGPNPELGILSMADAVVVAGHAAPRLLRACALRLPIYVTDAGPLTPRERRLHKRLAEANHVRRLAGEVGAWPRETLDEAERAAMAVRALLTPVGESRG